MLHRNREDAGATHVDRARYSDPMDGRRRCMVSPTDPRAPSRDEWERMSEEERQQVLGALPGDVPVSGLAPPEGDTLFQAKLECHGMLAEHFRQQQRLAYVTCDLPVYYPDEPMFAPDLLVVMDVSMRARTHWVVSAEGRGPDLILELLHTGTRMRDLTGNVGRYARLGVREYFVHDCRRGDLQGFRLAAPGAHEYAPIPARLGRMRSEALGLDLYLEGARLRFVAGDRVLLTPGEMIDELQAELVDLRFRCAAVDRAQAELRQEREALRQERDRLQQRAEDAEDRLADVMSRIAALEDSLRQR